MAEAIDLSGTDPHAVPIEQIDVSRPELMQNDAHWGYFERLRKEDPIHYCASSMFGPFWSLTKFEHIMVVERNWQDSSSDAGMKVSSHVQLLIVGHHGGKPGDAQEAALVAIECFPDSRIGFRRVHDGSGDRSVLLNSRKHHSSVVYRLH